MRVLVACEFSGVVRDAFTARGHFARSVDLLPSQCGGSGHVCGDMFALEDIESYDLVVAHPPCTRICNSGVRWLNERNLWAELDEAAAFFKRVLELPVGRLAVENPIPHRYALERIGRKYDQIIQPWQFGHGETKATCLWLKSLPKLVPTNIVNGREQRIHKLPPSADRWKLRAKTYQGIADAMAQQWGDEERFCEGAALRLSSGQLSFNLAEAVVGVHGKWRYENTSD